MAINEAQSTPICRHHFDAQRLMTEFPPKLRHRNKKLVFGITCPPGAIYSGQIVFSRWRAMPLPQTISWDTSRPTFDAREDVFGYEPSADSSIVEWYLNFAHHDLFTAYGGPLFAQDEMQVAEHPALGALREALLGGKIEPLCVENGVPTPALVKGVERRCAVATDRNAAMGRPYGLYGNNFAAAKEDTVRQATRAISPPTRSNILAMEAPAFGTGIYTVEQINYILSTAYTGFAGAKIESGQGLSVQASTVVHTGFWGCGAYGGNRILMALLQLVAACLSKLDRLVFHTFDQAGTKAYLTALEVFEREVSHPGRDVKLVDLLTRIQTMGFQWGVSDGN